jgi:hypothetical protein
MESKLVSLQTSLDAVSDTEKLRSQSRENNELQLKVVDLLNELSEVREAKETLRVEFEQQDRIHKRQLLDEVANGKQMCADRDGYKTRVGCLEAELKDMACRNERLVDEAHQESKEFVNVRNRLEETVNGYAIETSDMKKAFLKEKAEMSNAVDDTRKKNHELKRFVLGIFTLSALKNTSDHVRDLKAKVSTSEREYVEKLRVAREEEWTRISRLEAEKQEVIGLSSN